MTALDSGGTGENMTGVGDAYASEKVGQPYGDSTAAMSAAPLPDAGPSGVVPPEPPELLQADSGDDREMLKLLSEHDLWNRLHCCCCCCWECLKSAENFSLSPERERTNSQGKQMSLPRSSNYKTNKAND